MISCKTDPRAPHGFVREASHANYRYVCECESWHPPGVEYDYSGATQALIRSLRMKPSSYILERARAICEGRALPTPLDDDWVEYVQLTMPMDGELADWNGRDRILRLCLAASIAEAEGR